MSDVFVSYKAEDRKRVAPLVAALEAEGLGVWWDEQIGGGTGWRKAIETELNAARCVIVVWSKRSVGDDGSFVQDEASRAQRRQVYLPVTIDKIEPPLGFGEIQALPLTGWHGDRSDNRYVDVRAAVREIIDGTPRSGRRTVALRSGVDRRAAIAGGAAVAVAAASAGWYFLTPGRASATDSIAVLPFANLSGNPAQSYFSDGIAEEIRSALARIAGLKVVGRTSSEAVRNDDAKTAAKKLGVANILTGSVRESPSTIRINAELVDGRTGIDRWSQGYDRAPGDAIKIQTDIAENVASALGGSLDAVARAAIALGGTSIAAAQDSYLKARAQFRVDDSEQGVRDELRFLNSAIAIDPKFAKAVAFKAMLLAELTGSFNHSGRFESGFVEAAAVARQAIDLAPNLGAGHMALARTLVDALDFKGAVVAFAKANELSVDVDTLVTYSNFLGLLGKTDKAVDLARRAQALDPLNPITFLREGFALTFGRRYAEALPPLRKALELAPTLASPRSLVAANLMQMGRNDEAAAELRKVQSDEIVRLVIEAILFTRLGNRAASNDAISRLRQNYGDGATYQFAEIHAQRGEKEQAFAALDRAWSLRDPGLEALKADPYLDPLRDDPRFKSILSRLNFPG
jgi:TolB-like protein